MKRPLGILWWPAKLFADLFVLERGKITRAGTLSLPRLISFLAAEEDLSRRSSDTRIRLDGHSRNGVTLRWLLSGFDTCVLSSSFTFFFLSFTVIFIFFFSHDLSLRLLPLSLCLSVSLSIPVLWRSSPELAQGCGRRKRLEGIGSRRKDGSDEDRKGRVG
ncbi:hypothetical protein IE53DRAFT_65459 [Violaceomyces palustris]|uniref:Uncharacterized protein n=1 Tax=Violaceomyces palustris TaxID=1673888 RepID=A0ACD0NZ85_9BASI|nr:hypothetical protein IE53DRAFT_65459 [Violaceomyces palustris]